MEREGKADTRKARIPGLRVILTVDGTVISIPRPAPLAAGEERKVNTSKTRGPSPPAFHYSASTTLYSANLLTVPE
jgi:hypothetical protein